MKTKTTLSALLAFALLTSPGLYAQEAKKQAAIPETVSKLEEQLVSVVSKVSPAFVVIGGGSGVVISPDGYMLTNHHVAGGRPIGAWWRVKLPDDKIYRAQMIGTDQFGDISLLKIRQVGGKPFPYVKMADSDKCKVGQWVVALGNPFGFAKDSSPTVTVGLISAKNRYMRGYGDAIQTDAAINSGNSGGPLLNTKGELVGINGMIYTRHQVKINSGAGFAISSNQIKRFLPVLKAGGQISHGRIQAFSANEAKDGVEPVVSSVFDDALDVKEGDVIVAIEDIPTPNIQRYRSVVSTFPATSKVNVSLKRGDKTVVVKVEVKGRKPQNRARLNGFLGARMKNVGEDAGLVVTTLTKKGPAEKAGLKVQDVVIAMDGQKVSNLKQIADLLVGRRPGEVIRFTVKRGEETKEINIKLGVRP